MTLPERVAKAAAEEHTKSVWAHGEMLPKHMTEAFLKGVAYRDESVRELVEAGTSVWNLEHINRTTYSPTALASYNKAIVCLGEALSKFKGEK